MHERPAEIWMKFNSLSSYDMGQKLYEASQAGVKVKLIVRGVCCKTWYSWLEREH